MFVSLQAATGEVGPADRVICRGQRVFVDDIHIHRPGNHPKSAIRDDMIAIQVVTERGDRWIGADHVQMIGDRVRWRRDPSYRPA